jgi:hypothetical protein
MIIKLAKTYSVLESSNEFTQVKRMDYKNNQKTLIDDVLIFKRVFM